MESAGKARRVLIIVENLPSPFDRRVWQEATTLHDAGYEVTIICPTGKGYEKRYEFIDGIRIYRYKLPFEAGGPLGYAIEYSFALIFQFFLAWRVFLFLGFDVIHACNPPDNIFLIGGFFKLFGKKFLFDHHDINPELYEAKFGRRDLFYKIMLLWERWTFKMADVTIATNESYKRIAIERGGMRSDKVFVVRSGPDLKRVKIVPPDLTWKNGRKYLVGYVGVMGKQEGLGLLLESVRYLVYDKKRKDIQFVLVGDGTELEKIKSIARRFDLNDYVTFTGRVPDDILLSIRNTSDLFVNPEVYNVMNDKSTMNKIMEYMALGKPIVQFDLTEGRFSAQEASLYARRNDPIDMAEKILELLNSHVQRRKMSEFGRRRVEEELEWCHECPKLLAAYDALWKVS